MKLNIARLGLSGIGAALTLTALSAAAWEARAADAHSGAFAASLEAAQACKREFRNEVLRSRGMGYRAGNCDARAEAGSPVYQLASFAGAESDSGTVAPASCSRSFRNSVLRARGIGQWECGE